MSDHERFIEDPGHEMTEDQVRNKCMDNRYGFDPAEIVEVEGGWHCFEYVTDFETWEKQI
jgi:hypothetical protein